MSFSLYPPPPPPPKKNLNNLPTVNSECWPCCIHRDESIDREPGEAITGIELTIVLQ